ncbi:MAG: hypothetical protein QF701_04645 [Nitrospinota bacterium]|jgi:cyclopropane-fatty-acyl-phospholipid synthase|nr:hypothetical protein [Nitrospinota bacterium]MDP7167036.1 hypothetical protein [Nitrospinota bacterium]MDP7368973.1 hypothetical protein [Nitrospinota bacterium]HJP13624.1 hypothetical protein [Nitrospinota bacterium]
MGSDTHQDLNAAAAAQILRDIYAPIQVGFRVRLWDDAEISLGRDVRPVTVVIPTVQVFKRLLMNPTAAEFGEAYCDGDIDLIGDLFDVMPVADEMEALELSYWDKMKIALRVKRLPE